MGRPRCRSAVRALIVTTGVAMLGLWVDAAHAITVVQKCQEQKLKAQGKLQLCLKKNSAKVIGGKPDASATCQQKFGAALVKAGLDCRYLDNGDGTVSDLNTGLMWEQKDNLDSIANPSDPHDADNTYSWSTGTNKPDATAYTDFLGALNGGTSPDGTTTSGCFASHCDWRLPTVEELSGIVDLTVPLCGTGPPCIDPAFSPTQAIDYWSATTYAGVPSAAWLVYFYDGSVFAGDKSSNSYVRAVRGGL